MESVTLAAYNERIEHEWYLRNISLTEDFPMNGSRRELVLFVLAHCSYLFAQVRILAQDNIVTIAAKHFGAPEMIIDHSLR